MKQQLLNKKTGNLKTMAFMALNLFFVTHLMAQTPALVSSDATNPKYFTEYDGKLFFNAKDTDNKEWLWSTDGIGTTAHKGTVPVDHPGSQPQDLTVFNNQLIFSSVLKEGTKWNRELFEFDGKAPSLIKNIQANGESAPAGFGEFKNKLYFAADDGQVGTELWTTDGTSSGTQLLANLALALDHSNPHKFFEYDEKLLFVANDYYFGHELYSTDGTTSGTLRITDILPGWGDTLIDEFTLFKDKVYFVAYELTHGREPWITDGTESGTYMLKDIRPGLTFNYHKSEFTEYEDKLYFTAIDDTHGQEIWVTDGTENGLELFLDLYPGINSSAPTGFTIYKDKLFFGARSDGNNRGLFLTDGTEAGTSIVKTASSKAENLFIYDQKLFFTAKDGSNGRQLWLSDGTASGTQMVMTVDPLNKDAIPEDDFEYAVVDGTLYFTADYDGSGLKLWKLTGAALNVENQTKSEFLAYPNPVQNILHVASTPENIQKVDLFSITGQSLKTWKKQIDIDMSEFSPGLYFIKITTIENHTAIKQIIKN